MDIKDEVSWFIILANDAVLVARHGSKEMKGRHLRKSLDSNELKLRRSRVEYME